MNIDINTLAISLGWSRAGVTSPEISSEDHARFERWIKESKGAGMNYLERRKIERLDPRKYFADVKSVLVFAISYFQGWAEGPVKVSNYAWGEDYHTLLRGKLEATVLELKKLLGDFSWRACVDTAPVLEKVLAVKAGLGWQGKNTLVINSKIGSTFFIGELFTSLPLHVFSLPTLVSDHCGTCQRCIEACPTDALTPYVLDASKCISYWTLEHKGEFNSATPHYENWVAGCDICQEVCPWNQKLLPLNLAKNEFQNLTEADLKSPEWNERVKHSALSYVAAENWNRNLQHIQRTKKNSTEARNLLHKSSNGL